MLGRGDRVPHVELTTVTGEPFRYVEIWQRRRLLLLALGHADDGRSYTASVLDKRGDVHDLGAECVVTADPVPGLPGPAVLVADEWGEIAFVASSPTTADLPGVETLLDWLRYVAVKCPECEGEAR